MYDYYDYGYQDFESFGETATRAEEGLALVLGVYLVVLLLSLAVSLTVYVLQSLGLYGMSKNAGVANPWLAWLPVGNLWCIGSLAEISNQRSGKSKGAWRVVLPVLYVALVGGAFLLFGVAFVAGLSAGVTADDAVGGAVAFLGILLIFMLLYMAAAVALSVVTYVALYKTYKLFAPDNAVVYLLLSIFVGISQPIIFFLLRNRYPGGDKVPSGQSGPTGGQPYSGGQTLNGQPYSAPQPTYYGDAPAGDVPAQPDPVPSWEQAPRPTEPQPPQDPPAGAGE